MATVQSDRMIRLYATVPRTTAPRASSASLYPTLDANTWTGAPIATVTDGKVGPSVRRSAAGVSVVSFSQSNFFQIDRSRTYRTRFWARASATANGSLYFALRQYLSTGATGPVNDGRSPYKPGFVGPAPTQAWTEFSYTWAEADWQTGVTQVRPDFLLNYAGTAGYWEVQGFEMQDVTEVVAAQTKATEAFNNAALSTAILNQIALDNFLDRSEKAAVVKEWTAINNEIGGLVSQAAALGVSSADLTAAKVNLDNYLNGLSPTWSDTTQDTGIVRDTFNLQFNGYYGYRQTLCNAIYAKTSTMASGVTLSPTGLLSGGGTSGQITALAVIDLGTGSTVFGQRQRNDAPSDYLVGSARQFKDAYYLGVPGTVANTWCTLETTKQYPNGAGGGGVYQYVLIAHLTYRRFAPEAGGAVNTWQPWVQDIDRNVFTGDFNATNDLALVISGAGMTMNGNSATRTGGVAWDAACFSRDGYTGGASCSFVPAVGTHFMAGLNVDPTTDNSYTSLDYAFYSPANTDLYAWWNNGANNIGLGTYTPGTDVLAVICDGISIIWMKNGTVLMTVPAPSNARFHFDSSIVNGTLNNIRFGPANASTSNTSFNYSSPTLALIGNTITKIYDGGAWNAHAVSADAYTGGAYAAARIQTGSAFFGLDQSPYDDASYGSFDYSLYFEAGTSNVYAYESGVPSGILTTWTKGDAFAIAYDGSKVRYYKNGAVIRTVTAVDNLKFYFDSSFLQVNSSISNMAFGPMTSNAAGEAAAAVQASQPALTLPDFESNGPTGVRNFSCTASPTGGNGALTFAWAFQADPDFSGISVNGVLNAATINMRSISKSSGLFTSGWITCTVTDSKGLTATSSSNVTVNFS